MGKSSKARKAAVPPEEALVIPVHPELVDFPAPIDIVDTHTHLVSTYGVYRSAYPDGVHESLYAFARALYEPTNVKTVIDVWCEAPVMKEWKELANAGDAWGLVDYRFAMGALLFSLFQPSVSVR
jgi:TatD DNase family protein